VGSLDESKIIDREAEAEIFNSMLQFETPRRILLVSDKSGMGKSDVLRKLRYLCEYTHGVPAALLDLRELESRPDVFPHVVTLRNALEKGGARFPTFDAMNGARREHDRSYLPERWLKGVVNLAGAQIKDTAKVSGIMTVIEHPDHVYMGQPQWTDEDETEARSRCVESFLDDLMECSRKQSAVVLLDTVDKAGEEIQRWIFLELIRKRLLPTRKDCKLIIVLAGQGVAEMLNDRLQPADRECIEPIASLTGWDENHVAQFLAVHGYNGLKKAEIRIIHELLSINYTLAQALILAQTFTGMRHQ
jgi:5S rRNA maturation endonuclease (ribonuclease M5)